MFDNHDSKRHGKSLSHIIRLYPMLKTYKKCCVITKNIKSYAELFENTTGEKLFYKELKSDTFRVSLNAI
jgi:hypothetical protein